MLCVGATRSGKSRCLVLESICLLGLAGESIFCSDPKAELFHYTADFLKKLGYEVLVLDFKNPERVCATICSSPSLTPSVGRHRPCRNAGLGLDEQSGW
ncbi:MAG: type IV secretory system conjugative DNA transfer family protein [Oscillospiraceae bacterium]